MNVANDTPTGTADLATTAAVVSSCVVIIIVVLIVQECYGQRNGVSSH